MILAPYLTFNGNCEEALKFYASVFNGEIIAISYYEGTPLVFPADYAQKVMHAELIFENNRIQACDKFQDGNSIVNNYQLSLSFMEVFIMNDVFTKLANGGAITMSLQDTFWGARFGMLTDKFGIKWMFNCDLN